MIKIYRHDTMNIPVSVGVDGVVHHVPCRGGGRGQTGPGDPVPARVLAAPVPGVCPAHTPPP